MSSIAPQRSGSGGNGIGFEPIARKPGRLGLAAGEQVEGDLSAEATGTNAKPGVADRVGNAAAERGPVEGEEAAAGVDGTAPAMAKADPLELREER